MKQLIYASMSHPDVTFDTVQDILTVANRENKTFAISGVLLYNGIYFLQCIEGDEKNIDQLCQNISNDYRHNDVKIIGSTIIKERDFPEWNMAYFSSSKLIQEVIFQESKKSDFYPHLFSFPEALNIMKRLIKTV